MDNGNQTFTFTHDGSETLTASFQYQVTDSNGASSGTATVNLTVNPQNDPPVANDDGPGVGFTLDEGDSLTITAAELTANDTDAEDGTPGGTVSIAGVTSNGGVVDNGNQTFSFTHDGGETTSATFQYQVTDSNGAASTVATVTLDINPQNDPPVASDDGPGGLLFVLVGESLTLSAAQLTDNDSDAEDGIPAGPVSLVGGEVNGTVSDNGDQTFTFTHDGSDTTLGSFQYQVDDADGATSNTATVSITVSNLLPVAACARGGRRVQVDVAASIATAGEFSGGPYVFSQVGLPASFGIDPATGIISGTAVAGDLAGSPFEVVVSADDSSTVETLEFLLTVDANDDVSFYSSFEESCFGL